METLLMKDAMTVISERKSVRKYTGELISKPDIEKILKAAMAAPSAMHMLPWKFVVVSEPDTLKQLSAQLPFAQMLEKAGTAIVVCAVPEEAAGSNEAYAILDCACASENILLAAEALGLGAVWTAVYPDEQLMVSVRKVLNIPGDVIPLNIIPVGHPAGEESVQDKYNPVNIHWGKWS